MNPSRAISAAVLGLWAVTSSAQQPLSAIDWLNEANTATASPPGTTVPGEPPVASSVDLPAVQVTGLDAPRSDAAGLLPGQSTGLPVTLWQASAAEDLIRRLDQLPSEPLPAVQALYFTLLLAEANAPLDAGRDGAFLSARLNALWRFGAIEPALALIESAGAKRPGLFDQWLDLSLLVGQEDRPCAELARRPHLTGRLDMRVYCTARAGDWPTAALIYDSAVALGQIGAVDQTLLALYLDPELIEAVPPPTVPSAITPLQFRLFEAIGTPLPTHNLPRAFANADLRGTSGWKSELEAAERLAVTGALPAARLFGLYTARRPAASGGVWDRVAAIQRLDESLNAGDAGRVAQDLPVVWAALRSERLEVALADLLAPRLDGLSLPQDVADIVLQIRLLSSGYETAAAYVATGDPSLRFLADIATGQPSLTGARTPLERAIAAGFAAGGPAAEHQPLLERGQVGEAILDAASLLQGSSAGNRGDLTAGIATLRALGLEDTARRAALQLLLLDGAG